MEPTPPSSEPAAPVAPPRNTAVVGGGLAGLTCAGALAAAGRRVTLFDKGRKPAGRISSRRAAGFRFDHGAQYFTARAPAFRAALEGWLAAGVAARWEGRIVSLGGRRARDDDSTERFVGAPSMSAVASHLTDALPESVQLRPGVRVGGLERDGERWELVDDQGLALGGFDDLVLALPAQQAAALLPPGRLAALAASVPLAPCWAVMLGLSGRYDVDFDGAFCDGALSWVARDSSKPGRRGGEAWVLHGSPLWSAAALELERPQVIAALTAALEGLTGVPLPRVSIASTHLWRCSQAPRPLLAGALFDDQLRIGLAGDWCAGSRVEGAWSSGLELARRMLAGEPTPPIGVPA